MKRTDFFYDLPQQLIAKYPAPRRTGSRLLCLDGVSGEIRHRQFEQLPTLLSAGDLLVFNDTRVIPARLYGQKSSGGRVEILLERILGDHQVLAQVRASKSPRAGAQIRLFDQSSARLSGLALTVMGRREDLFELQCPLQRPILEVLDECGHVPLPPYIDRPDESCDMQRYQTVYARQPGAVAAPTAGLHFDRELLRRLAAEGVASAFVTLHVGAGTFQPVRVDDIREHKMHAEWIEVSSVVCEQITQTRSRGGRVIAVGTTSVRCLETASQGGELRPYAGDTDIFIYPDYRFAGVDALISNFHLPESTLLMLVSAFAGRPRVLAAYRQAVENRYRFFSYGDAMLIHGTDTPFSRQQSEPR